MKTLLAIIIYRSQLEKEQDETLMEFSNWIGSIIYNHPFLCLTFVVLLILLILFLKKKF